MRTTIVIATLLALLSTRQSAGSDRTPPVKVPVDGAAVVGGKPIVPLADNEFYFRDLGHRCIDLGAPDSWHAGSPVYIYSCNGMPSQRVRVTELDESHDVELRATTMFCIGAQGKRVAAAAILELQPCDGSPAQRFALDGDSILAGAQTEGRVTREFAVEPSHKRTENKTPLTLAARELSDAEYFRYEAVDHSGTKPTSGFVVVSDEAALDSALKRGWGTVVEVGDSAPIVLTKTPVQIPGGVTLRGYRKYRYQGPEIRTCTTIAGGGTIELDERAARITGLRFRGPTSDPACTGALSDDSSAIRVNSNPFLNDGQVLVDHVDIGYWHGHGIDVRGGIDQKMICDTGGLPRPRHASVLAVGNFIHHNTNYGIVTGQAAFIVEQGNVFYDQGAHSIASDPANGSGYAAYDNLILTNDNLFNNHTHDIDMHGSLNPGHWEGGIAGDYFDVGWNSVLANGHTIIDMRGTPCRKPIIQFNVFVHGSDGLFENHSENPHWVDWHGNQVGVGSPMGDLAIGDFDGDGISDVFVGTGAAWYYSSGAASEWRFLNRMPEHASQLRFGDFDGDGRTDVMAVIAGQVSVSWGGISPWEPINVVAWPLSEIAVGNFDGDGKSDLLLSTGSQWFLARGGRNWELVGSSHVHVADLLFGDFTHSGHTQVLRISSSHEWQIVDQLPGHWRSLGSSRDASLHELVVGDFDADGFADVARSHGGGPYEFTTPRLGPGWVRQSTEPGSSLVGKPLGRFDEDPRTGLLFLSSDRDFYVLHGLKGNVGTRLSRQEMD